MSARDFYTLYDNAIVGGPFECDQLFNPWNGFFSVFLSLNSFSTEWSLNVLWRQRFTPHMECSVLFHICSCLLVSGAAAIAPFVFGCFTLGLCWNWAMQSNLVFMGVRVCECVYCTFWPLSWNLNVYENNNDRHCFISVAYETHSIPIVEFQECYVLFCCHFPCAISSSHCSLFFLVLICYCSYFVWSHLQPVDKITKT